MLNLLTFSLEGTTSAQAEINYGDFDQHYNHLSYAADIEESSSIDIFNFERVFVDNLDINEQQNPDGRFFLFHEDSLNTLVLANEINAKPEKIDYWQTVYSIESKQGKLLYRPRNRAKNCTWTTAPCGHHQLSVKALKDIGCKSLQCRKDRLNYSKSLKMSKKLLALNEKRLKKNGFKKLIEYQRYLIHQQGANGIRTLLAAIKGDKLLSKRMKLNMASNSPYSYRQLRRMGSKLAAKKFMQHWENKWQKEKLLIAGLSDKDAINTVSKNTVDEEEKPFTLPTFSMEELSSALDFRYLAEDTKENKTIDITTTTREKTKDIHVKSLSKKDIVEEERKPFIIPSFNDTEIHLALNYKF